MGANTRWLWALVIIAAAVAAVSSAGCTSSQTQSPTPGALASFLLYTNKNAGVEINYPNDWQLTGNSGSNTIATFEHGNESVLFQIQITAIQSGKTPQSLAPSLISAIQKSSNGFSLLENHTASFGGLPGYEIVVTYAGPGGQSYKALVIWTVKGNSIYEIQFTGVAAQYDEQIATAQQMIASFKLTRDGQ